MNSTHEMFTNGFLAMVYGNFKVIPNKSHNKHQVYQSVMDSQSCLYVNNENKWVVWWCNDKGSPGYLILGTSGKCPDQVSSWFILDSAGAPIKTDLSFSCLGGECPPCKSVTSGPYAILGTYLLDQSNTLPVSTRCKDSCVYKKGDKVFCFELGGPGMV